MEDVIVAAAARGGGAGGALDTQPGSWVLSSARIDFAILKEITSLVNLTQYAKIIKILKIL